MLQQKNPPTTNAPQSPSILNGADPGPRNLPSLSTNSVSAPPVKTGPGGRVGWQKRLNLHTLSGQFTGLVLLCLVLAVGALIASYLMLYNTQDRFKRIISESAPTITAVLQLGQAIQEADAKATNYQLLSRVDVTSPDFNPAVYGENGLRNQTWNDFLNRQREVNDWIFTARSNISGTRPGEAEAINAISDRFLEYVGQIRLMRSELDQGNKEQALAAYKAGRDLLVGNLNNVPLDANGRSPEEQLKLNGWNNLNTAQTYLGIEANLQKLYQINLAELKRANDEAKGAVDRNIFAAITVTVILGLALAFLSFRHAIVTHRLINPGYILALLGALGIGLPLIINLIDAKNEYRIIADESFPAIETSARIRQYVADANADLARLLLSPESPGLNSTNSSLTADVRKAFQTGALQTSFNSKIALLDQQLGSNNLYYQPQSNFPAYKAASQSVRDNFTKGLLSEAIKQEIGPVAESFNKFDTSVKTISEGNQARFDQNTCKVVGSNQSNKNCKDVGYVPLLQIAVLIIFPLIALAVLGGFWYVRRQF